MPNFVKLSISDVRQGSEYALGPGYVNILNMAVSDYCGICLDRVLDIYIRFWTCQGFECGRVINMQGLYRVLNMPQ